jgi:hypothetical protein
MSKPLQMQSRNNNLKRITEDIYKLFVEQLVEEEKAKELSNDLKMTMQKMLTEYGRYL